MVALACFNIWRKLRKRPGISIEKKGPSPSKPLAMRSNDGEGPLLERKRMNQYTYHTTVLNADGDFRRMIKPSALFRYVEQAAADHARAYGMDDAFSKRTTRRFWWASRRRRSPGCPCVPKS